MPVVAALAFATLTIATACARPESPLEIAPRVVLVTLDTLNVRYTGPYSDNVDYTPALDRMAASGAVFEHAHTPVPITLPAHASLLSGRSPESVGVMLNNHRLGDEVETLPEILAARGYRTAAFVSLGVLEREFGLDQGFEHYDADRFRRLGRWYLTADEVVSAATDWVHEAAAEPFFLWVHLSDPHEPYQAAGAPPDVRVELQGTLLGEWSLTAKQRHDLELELPPGRHELVWTSLRAPRRDDQWETTLRLTLGDLDGLAAHLPAGGPDLEREIDLREPFRLTLVNGESSAQAVRLSFRGRLAEPPPSEVLEHYPQEVEYLDRHLGKLVDHFATEGLDEQTLWVVVSDHGEGLFNHRILGHSDFAHEDQLRIVWLMRGPGVPAGSRIETPGRLIQDVAPTVLELLGLPAPAAAEGVSQAPCFGPRGCPPRDEWWTFGADLAGNRLTAIGAVRWPYKILWQIDPGSGCYDVAADPWEQQNLCIAYTRDPSLMPDEVRILDAQLARRREALVERLAGIAPPPEDAERQEILRSLGYLGN